MPTLSSRPASTFGPSERLAACSFPTTSASVIGWSRRNRLLRLRPDQRHRLGKVADIVVGIAEQHRIHALGDQRAQHCRLDRRDRQVAGDRRQRQPAIGILDRAEIVDQQPELAVARRRQHQAVEELGERFMASLDA